MNARLFLWMLLAFAVGNADTWALKSAPRNYGAEMSVDADVQADFFKRYPDLEDEREAVVAAARTLAAEGVETRNDAEAAELLAKRARALLERRSPQEWQQKAISLFPELGVAGSEFNALFLRHFNELKQTSPQFLEEPSWPVLLARRCADELRPETPSLAAAHQPKNETPSSSVAQAASRSAWWISSLSVLALVVLIALPARWLFRCSRAFADGEGSTILWQRALRPVAWVYFGASLLAMMRTFQANADQRFLDRFGITLLVSLVTGVIFGLPAYLVSLGGMWWRRQRTPPAPRVVEGKAARTSVMHASERKT